MVASATPAIDRVFEDFADCLTPEVAERVAKLRLNRDVQRRLKKLAVGANEGSLSEPEAAEYRDLVEVVDLIGIMQAKARRVARIGNR